MCADENRNIVHFDLDTFFVSVERLLNPKLIGVPVLIGGTSDRGVVASCSYEARAFGVQNGMAMKIARRLCPHAVAMRGDGSVYNQHSKVVTQILRDNVPLLEKASVDEFYVDMTGMDRVFGIKKYIVELREKVMRETRLPISMGLSLNKTVSKVATGESKPKGQMMIDLGREKTFLAPLSVRKLPMVGGETFEVLSELGIKTIGTLQDVPQSKMEKVLGKNGITIWQRAQGVDLSPVKPYYERSSLSLERTFDKDTIDFTRLLDMLTAMVEGLGFQLRAGNKMTACISVKVRYSDMQVAQKQKRIPYTSCDHILLGIATRLLTDLFSRRQLVRLVGITLNDLVEGGHQINMLDDSIELIQLYQQMDYLKKKYHDSRLIMRANTMEQRSLGVWNPWTGEPPTPGGHRHA
jgi:DNA polymerase-4